MADPTIARQDHVQRILDAAKSVAVEETEARTQDAPAITSDLLEYLEKRFLTFTAVGTLKDPERSGLSLEARMGMAAGYEVVIAHLYAVQAAQLAKVTR